MPVQKETLELKVNGRTVRAYRAAPESRGPGILLLHAWWGLKPFFKRLCDRLADEGFVVLAPDLNDGKVARTVASAQKLLGQRDVELTQAVILSARDRLETDPARTGAKIGVIGFSMGAAWSLVLSTLAPEQIGSVVLFYGTASVDFGKAKASFLAHYAKADEWEPLEDVRAMEKAMRSAGLDVKFHIYPGAAHWFVEEDRPEYDPQAARLAWKRTLDFLKEGLS